MSVQMRIATEQTHAAEQYDRYAGDLRLARESVVGRSQPPIVIT
jgi:hypothetical protein